MGMCAILVQTITLTSVSTRWLVRVVQNAQRFEHTDADNACSSSDVAPMLPLASTNRMPYISIRCDARTCALKTIDGVLEQNHEDEYPKPMHPKTRVPLYQSGSEPPTIELESNLYFDTANVVHNRLQQWPIHIGHASMLMQSAAGGG